MSRPNPFFILITILLVACSLPASPTPYDMLNCTAMGCGFTLRIELIGPVPSDFVLTVSDSTGASASVHCLNGTNMNDTQTAPGFSAICGQTSVSFMDYSPQQVNIKVQWEGREISEGFQLDYKIFRPNGPQCEPECRTAEVTIRMPD